MMPFMCMCIYLKYLQVRLYHDENPGVPIHTVSLGVVSFFYLPSLQMDDKVGH